MSNILIEEEKMIPTCPGGFSEVTFAHVRFKTVNQMWVQPTKQTALVLAMWKSWSLFGNDDFRKYPLWFEEWNIEKNRAHSLYKGSF